MYYALYGEERCHRTVEHRLASTGREEPANHHHPARRLLALYNGIHLIFRRLDLSLTRPFVVLESSVLRDRI